MDRREDGRLCLSRETLQQIVENAMALLGNAEAQVDDFYQRVEVVARFPDAKPLFLNRCSSCSAKKFYLLMGPTNTFAMPQSYC